MAKKKRGVKRIPEAKSKSIVTGNIKKNINLLINNLLLFIALSLISLILFNFLQNDLLKNLFYVMAMVFGSVSVAFLITLIILLILKVVSKKRK